MAHYAFIDENNIVTEVIVGVDETQLIDNVTPETWYGQFRGQRCVRTSYNGTIRKNFAGIGYTYDENIDAFVPPRCHATATFDESTALWECSHPDHDWIVA